MAKYRPVDVRLWSDRKFLSLGPDARMLWLYLLTSPFSLPIPGVIIAGEMAIAEQLGWSVDQLRKGYQEVLGKGLSLRIEGRFVWLTKALSYQKIQGPKHIEAMRKCWDDVPDCDDKLALWQALKIACKTWNRLFDKGFPIPLAIPLVEGLDTVTVTVTPTVTPTVERESAPTHADPGGLVFDPNRIGAKREIAEAIYRRLSDERLAAAARLGIANQIAFPPLTPATRPQGFRELLDRVAEEGTDAPRVCEIVVSNLVAEAAATKSIEWLSEKAFTAGGWRHARSYVPGQRAGPATRSPHVGRVEPLRAEEYPEGDQTL